MGLSKMALLAAGALLLSAGAAAAAEGCGCCKSGEPMACCDKMKDGGKTAPDAPAQPQPQHQH